MNWYKYTYVYIYKHFLIMFPPRYSHGGGCWLNKSNFDTKTDLVRKHYP